MSSAVYNLSSGSSEAVEVAGSDIINVETQAAIASVTPGSSPWTYTNAFDGPIQVAVTGGTVTVIAFKRGATSITTGDTTGIFLLNVGDSLVVTYSSAPTVQTIPFLA